MAALQPLLAAPALLQPACAVTPQRPGLVERTRGSLKILDVKDSLRLPGSVRKFTDQCLEPGALNHDALQWLRAEDKGACSLAAAIPSVNFIDFCAGEAATAKCDCH